ncbi:MAG TPA: DUF885 family protein, partial [Thermoplasmata archaeon]|nr:DUF885 family protein [Thermoplasmata archaeon]
MTESARDPAAAEEFDRLERSVIDHLFVLQPGYAVFLGLHEYDGRMPDFSSSATERWLAEADRLHGRLSGGTPEGLPTGRRLDRTLLELLLESPVFDLREARGLDQNPMSFLGSISLTAYLVREYAPVPARVSAIVETLRAVPALLDAGRRRLEAHLPRPFLEIALSMGNGLPRHFDEAEEFAGRASASLRRHVAEARSGAEAAVTEFLGRIRDDWMPKANDDFALGPERYQRLLWVREGLRTPFAEILEEGSRDLARNRARFEEIARSSTPPATAEVLLEGIYRDHPSAPELVPTAQRYVGEVRQFVVDRQLVSIPVPDRCRVEETPTYGRAMSTASMNPPGPFDVGGEEGIYFVTPVDAAWST